MPETPAPETPATPTPVVPAPVTPPPVTPPPAVVTLTGDEYRALLDKAAKLSETEATAQRDADEKEASRIKALADRGEIQAAMDALKKKSDTDLAAEKTRADSLEAQILSGRKETVVTQAITEVMSGRTFVSPDAAADVRDQIARLVDVTRDATGQVVVVEKGSNRPASEVIKALLAPGATRFAHCISATSRGGTGAGGGNTPPPAGGDQTPKKTFSEAAIAHERAKRSVPSTNPYGLAYRTPARN